jgi:hypothetical protein
MNKHLVAVIIAASAAIAAPAFASSGYGPAPHYNPIDGAPSSQRGESAMTIHAENTNADAQAFGGVADTTARWGSHVQANGAQSLFAHH